MKAPDKIFIAETPNKLIEIWSDEPIESKPYITEHEYIRRDALLEWAKKENLKFNQIGNDQDDDFARGIAAGFGFLISKLGSL